MSLDWLLTIVGTAAVVALLIVVVGGVAAVAVVVKQVIARLREPVRFPYTDRGTLFTQTELAFLGALEKAVGRRWRVFGKVHLADLVSPRSDLTPRRWSRALKRIRAHRVDFVLCSPGDLAPAAVVELDDGAVHPSGRRRRESDLDALMSAVGLPLLRIPTQNSYSIVRLREQIDNALVASYPDGGDSSEVTVRDAGTLRPEPWIEERARTATGRVRNGAEERRGLAPESARPISPKRPDCPRCGRGMRRRRSTKGAHAGKSFWTCSDYPQCRGVLPAPAATPGTDDPTRREGGGR